MSKSPSTLRCAIYTRKSTEEGLEQEFNSLDAQRESCAAYIASQASMGWKAVPRHYDDGGISGGTMERPALQDLLSDIRAGKIDVVVVYKIDRLTRSLMDFARIVEVFDAQKVSFVSVTQQFNTLSSMGRLTLNVLLSFAQFEREVTAERIRDKIAASKRKGMWMGGAVPMGYEARDKKLVVNPEEAEVIRRIFQLYLELGSVRLLKERLDELGLVTKMRGPTGGSVAADTSITGSEAVTSSKQRLNHVAGGKSFTRGHLHWLLTNPIYAGDIRHKDQIVTGQHEAIIDRDLWEAVQTTLKGQTHPRSRTSNLAGGSLLGGVLFDETGDRLTPSHAIKDGKRYRYYISQRLMQARKRDASGWRLPAEELEATILAALRNLLADHQQLLEIIGGEGREATAIKTALDRATNLGHSLSAPLDQNATEALRTILARIEIEPGQITLSLSRDGLRRCLGIETLQRDTDGKSSPDPAPSTICLPFVVRRRGVESRLVIGGEQQRPPSVDQRLIDTIARAMNWMQRLTSGAAKTTAELAREDGIDDGEISRTLPLAFLAPDIVDAIVQGRQPVALTTRYLKRLKPLPASWAEQRCLLGFEPARSA
jgi:site-specific DNA recombinase